MRDFIFVFIMTASLVSFPIVAAAQETAELPLNKDMDTPSSADVNGQEFSVAPAVSDAPPLEINAKTASGIEMSGEIAAAEESKKEIQIETKVLRIVLNDEHADGVDWEAIVSDYQETAFPGFTMITDGRQGRQLHFGVISKEDYGVLLDALDTVGAVNIIFDETARIKNKERSALRIFSSSAGARVEADGALASGHSSQDQMAPEELMPGEEVRFDLMPSIHPDGLIKVSVRPALIHHPSAIMGGENEPSVSVQIEEGATIVIGGLFEEVMVESSWKVPLLGDLPLLGFVFRNQGESARREEIITFVTVKTMERNEPSLENSIQGSRVK